MLILLRWFIREFFIPSKWYLVYEFILLKNNNQICGHRNNGDFTIGQRLGYPSTTVRKQMYLRRFSRNMFHIKVRFIDTIQNKNKCKYVFGSIILRTRV